MRESVNFFINGKQHEVRGADVLCSLSHYLRRRLRLSGTKIVCEEGDCGSCTVLVRDVMLPDEKYMAIDSCIAFLFQLDGKHVVTVEGVGTSESLSAVQKAMIDCHGSQCGYCTPGFVMSMTGVLESHPRNALSKLQWQQELAGNLCRCTGYDSILDACEQAAADYTVGLDERYPIESMRTAYLPYASDIAICIGGEHGTQRVFVPRELTALLELKSSYPTATIMAGGTDIGVRINKRTFTPEAILDLSKIGELRHMSITESGHIEIGAGVPWTQVLALLRQRLPQFAEIISVFGSVQIRNAGTIGGNIANASPIADSLPALYVLDAELELCSIRGKRLVKIADFYLGYKKLDLSPDEIITKIKFKLPTANERLELTKIARRRDLDISTFTSAIRMKVIDDEIVTCSIAMGAVGPTVVRLRAVEEYLLGKPLTMDSMERAGEIAAQIITPITDVRGSIDYRRTLAKNVFLKFLFAAHGDQSSLQKA